MTIPTGADTSSAGVKATCTRMDAGTLTARGGHAVLLPAPGPGDGPQLLRVRPPDLRRLHEHGAGRHPLSRPRGNRPPVEPDREGGPPEPVEWHARHEGAHRVQRRLLPHHRRPGRRRQPARGTAVRRVRALRAARRRRGLVAAHHRRVPPREPAPHRLQHARAVVGRRAPRGGDGPLALPLDLLRLGADGIGRRATGQPQGRHGRRVRRDLRPLRCDGRHPVADRRARSQALR